MDAAAGVRELTKATFPSLARRATIVTGGASGIGAAIVRGFVRNGARVALLDIDGAAGTRLADELGGEVMSIECDLTDTAGLQDAVREAEAALGPISALVNNAANDQRHTIEEITPEIWDASQAINLRQQFFVSQAVLPGMKTAGGGSIVNLSSVAWRWGHPDMLAYTSAKSGIIGLTRSLGTALGEHGIRVNAVAPGAVMTERQMRLWHTPESKARAVAAQVLHTDLLEDDIADAVLFLSADDSRMITRQCLTVDGGSR